MRVRMKRDETSSAGGKPEKQTESSGAVRERMQALIEQVFLGQPLLVLEDEEGRRYTVGASGNLRWEDELREDAPPLRAVERNIEVKLNALFGRLVELEGLEPDPTLDAREDLVAGLQTVEVCHRDLVSALNNVALARHALAAGDAARALDRLDWALSWCGPMLGVDHPAMGEAGPGEPARLLTPKACDQRCRGRKRPSNPL